VIEWNALRDFGACRDLPTDMFFDPARIVDAVAICRGCPVRPGCLQWAHTNLGSRPVGVWGGVSFNGRRMDNTKRQCRGCGRMLPGWRFPNVPARSPCRDCVDAEEETGAVRDLAKHLNELIPAASTGA